MKAIDTRKAQFAMEYVLVIAVLFMLLVPGMYIYFEYSQKSLEQIGSSKIGDIGNSIINNAENSYFLGTGSKISLDMSMPPGVKSITINCAQGPPLYCEIAFSLESGDIPFSTNVPLRIKDVPMVYGTPQSFAEEDYSSGQKKIIIESVKKNDFEGVEIDIE